MKQKGNCIIVEPQTIVIIVIFSVTAWLFNTPDEAEILI